MLHHTSLITTIVAGLGLAFLLGVLASRLRLSPLVGYLLAGVLIGPFTPGYVADQELAPQLAEIGVILLMFGVGRTFRFRI
jgi:CPA2 family monovalent cation:H+ antiporter-2